MCLCTGGQQSGLRVPRGTHPARLHNPPLFTRSHMDWDPTYLCPYVPLLYAPQRHFKPFQRLLEKNDHDQTFMALMETSWNSEASFITGYLHHPLHSDWKGMVFVQSHHWLIFPYLVWVTLFESYVLDSLVPMEVSASTFCSAKIWHCQIAQAGQPLSLNQSYYCHHLTMHIQ